MTGVAPPRPLLESDDREAFDCGRESLNNWFRRHAWFNQLNDISRVNVITDAASGRILGYVTLSAGQIERAFLSKPMQRNRPGQVPVLLLGQLAVDKAFQGQGLGVDLLLFALKTAMKVSETVGGVGVITHPLNEALGQFYARWGFQDIPFDPRRAMIVRMVDLKREFGDT